jgi:hypothetical protein
MLTRREQNELLEFIKALADENRLRILALITQDEHRVSDLAAQLGVTEPTASHHLARLRQVGLVNLRVSGNQRFCRLNADRLRRFKQLAMHIEMLDTSAPAADDLAWIDKAGLELTGEERRVLSDYIVDGRLTQIPARQKKQLVILRWLATRFEPDVKYTEKEVNQIIGQVHDDFATLRRDLVDFGYLRRERGGGHYWLTPENETA